MSLKKPHDISRRTALAGLAGLCAAPTIAVAAPAETLATIAAMSGFKFGSVCDIEVFDDPAYLEIILRETSFTGAANAFKYDWLRPWGPAADFANADRLLEIANKANKPYVAQSLFWNDYPPKWLTAEPRLELQRLFDSHLTETLTRYRGRISSWIVVNEPFAPWTDADGMYRTGPWYTAHGADYIARAFKQARDLDPSAKLVLNEGWCERDDAWGRKVRNALLSLVKKMKDDLVPLDAVGLQGHLQPQYPKNDAAVVAFIEKLAAEGVEIHITELDVDDSSMPGTSTQRDALVARRYSDYLNAVLPVPAVKSVSTWGLTDRYTWYDEVAREAAKKRRRKTAFMPRPLPFDRQLKVKPAYAAIAAAFRKNARTKG